MEITEKSNRNLNSTASLNGDQDTIVETQTREDHERERDILEERTASISTYVPQKLRGESCVPDVCDERESSRLEAGNHVSGERNPRRSSAISCASHRLDGVSNVSDGRKFRKASISTCADSVFDRRPDGGSCVSDERNSRKTSVSTCASYSFDGGSYASDGRNSRKASVSTSASSGCDRRSNASADVFGRRRSSIISWVRYDESKMNFYPPGTRGHRNSSISSHSTLSGRRISSGSGSNPDYTPRDSTREPLRSQGDIATDHQQPASAAQDSSHKPEARFRKSKTLGALLAFLVMGFNSSLLGASMVDLEHMLGINTSTFSTLFTVGGACCLVGAVLVGAVFDKANRELLFSLALLLTGLAVLVMPHVKQFPLFVVADGFRRIGEGYTLTATNLYIADLWMGNKYLNSILQIGHGMWSAGSTTGPLILQAFVVPKVCRSDECIGQSNNSSFGVNTELGHNFTSNDTHLPREDGVQSTTTQLLYGYSLIGGVMLLTMVYFTITFVLAGPSCLLKKHNVEEEGKESSTTQIPKPNRRVFYVFIPVFFFFYLGGVYLTGNFLAIFVVKGLKQERVNGSILTSLYYGAMGLGRVLGVPIAWAICPAKNLTVDIALMCFASSLLMFSDKLPDGGVWAAVVVAGLGVSTAHGCVVTWLSGYIHLTGVVGFLGELGAQTAGVTLLRLAGYLFQASSPISVTYMIFATNVLLLLCWIAMLMYTEKFLPESKRDIGEVVDEHGDGEMPCLVTSLEDRYSLSQIERDSGFGADLEIISSSRRASRILDV